MPITWDADMDRKLFLAILKVHDVAIDTKAVAEELSTEDQSCTAMAIQKRVQKIKTQIKDGSTGEGTPKPKATPRKRAAGTADGETPSKKGKGKDGKAKDVAPGEGDDDEADAALGIKQEEAGEYAMFS